MLLDQRKTMHLLSHANHHYDRDDPHDLIMRRRRRRRRRIRMTLTIMGFVAGAGVSPMGGASGGGGGRAE